MNKSDERGTEESEAESSTAFAPSAFDASNGPEEPGWFVLGSLLRHVRLIVGVTFLVAVIAVILSLQLTVWYRATARVLPPEGGGGGGIASLIGDLSPVASSLLGGGGGGDYTRYRAILSSRSTLELVIERFDMIDVYEVDDEDFPEEEALTRLSDNLAFDVDLDMEYLEISVLDRSPERAARIANFLVEELNRRNEQLALQGARRFREYVESRYSEAEMHLDSSLARMQDFQERRGVIELPTMAQGLIESLAAQRAEVASADIQFEALRSEYGDENPQVKAAAAALAAAESLQRGLLSGEQAIMPVAMRDLPAVANEYAHVYQDVAIQKAIIENARPLLEQARFDEERDRVAVQVLDPAVAPKRKAQPKRAVIVLVSTFSAAALVMTLVVLLALIRRNRAAWRRALAASTLR